MTYRPGKSEVQGSIPIDTESGRASKVRSWWVWVLVGVLLPLSAARAAVEPEEVYLPTFNLIQQADSLNREGQATQAMAKYEQALSQIRGMQANYPNFNVKMLAYRSNDVALKIAGISAKLSPGGETEAGSPSGANAARGPASTAGSPQVKLIEPGGEPRKALRFHPKAGDKQTLVLIMKMAMGMKMGEAETPMKLPAMNMTMDVTVKSVSPNGDITYESVMSDVGVAEDPDVLPAVADAMKSALATVKGVMSSGVLTSRGINKGMNVKLPEGADPQMKQVMEQMKESFNQVSAPLPQEPIGTGAKWEVKMPIKSQGMTINQTATYELGAVEEDKITTKVTLLQTAANQKIQNPAMPGIKVDLTKLTSNGTGESSFDLSKVMPMAAMIDMHSEMSMGMNNGGQKQNMDMKLDVNMRFDSK